jgi:hypothetical protein
VSGRGYMLRSARGDWRTPPEIVEALHLLWDGPPDLDPCAPVEPPHIGRVNLCVPVHDGLAERWSGTVYVNPPFGDLDDWAAKCASEAKLGAEIVLLLPARTDTRYWHAHVSTAKAICFLRGRLKFVGAPGACPFPTALVYWGPRPWLFHRVFAARGMVVAP